MNFYMDTNYFFFTIKVQISIRNFRKESIGLMFLVLLPLTGASSELGVPFSILTKT